MASSLLIPASKKQGEKGSLPHQVHLGGWGGRGRVEGPVCKGPVRRGQAKGLWSQTDLSANAGSAFPVAL